MPDVNNLPLMNLHFKVCKMPILYMRNDELPDLVNRELIMVLTQ